MNFVSRSFCSLSFIVVEYTERPIYIVIFLTMITFSVSRLIKEPNSTASVNNGDEDLDYINAKDIESDL